MEGGETRLHWADYVVTVLCLVVALGIGVFFALFRGGQKTREAYLMGNRRMGLAPVTLSLFISFQSAITLIGVPSDTYNTGTMVFFLFVGISLANLVASFTLVPLVYPLRLTSVYHYLQLRFRSVGVKRIITAIAMLQLSLYMGVALYTPALVLRAVAGLSLWVSLVLVGGVGTVYTAIGGYKSVVWTDVFQTIIVFTGILTVLIKGLIHVGGFSKMATIAADGGRLIFAELDPKERHSLWSTVIGACFMWMVYVFNQATVQRVSSLPSLAQARRMFHLNTPLSLLYGGILTVMGVVLYAYFVTIGCDPYAAGYVENKNQVAPYFVLHVLRDLPGMTGLYMSMLFCGALSTLSSGINALAAITVEDVLASPLKGMKDTTVTVIAKFTVAGFGCLSLTLAYLMKNLSGPVTQMSDSVVGAFGSPVLGVFFLSAGFPPCNSYGCRHYGKAVLIISAMVVVVPYSLAFHWSLPSLIHLRKGAAGGILIGSAFSLTTAIGSTLFGAPTPSLPSGPVDRCDVTDTSLTLAAVLNVTSSTLGVADYISTTATSVHRSKGYSIWDISYLWLGVIGFWATVISGAIISLVTGCKKEAETVDPRLIFPCCRKLFGLPEPECAAEEDNALSLKDTCETGIHKHSDVTHREQGMETSTFLNRDLE